MKPAKLFVYFFFQILRIFNFFQRQRTYRPSSQRIRRLTDKFKIFRIFASRLESEKGLKIFNSAINRVSVKQNQLRAFLQIRNAAQIVERKIDDFSAGKIGRFVQAR